ncbi:DegV family protein [Deinococcus aquiradiocola]|nr:DegV family protein [Deinococcus aquiradiocola]
MPTAVLTDSTSDLTPDEQRHFGLFVLPLRVRFQDRQFMDHQNIDAQQMFAAVRSGADLPSTRPPTLDTFTRGYELLLQRHDHVLSVHLSAQLSETVQVARRAAKLFPGRVTVVDSRQSSGALAMQAERAARLVADGVPPSVVAEVLEVAAHSAVTRMSLDTLEYLRRNGRIGAAAALLGGLLNTKPIVGLDAGRVVGVARERGREAAIARMTRDLKEQVRLQSSGGARAVIFDNGDEEGAERLEAALREAGGTLFLRSSLGSVLSAHGGPGVCGFSIEPVQVSLRFRNF